MEDPNDVPTKSIQELVNERLESLEIQFSNAVTAIAALILRSGGYVDITPDELRQINPDDTIHAYLTEDGVIHLRYKRSDDEA